MEDYGKFRIQPSLKRQASIFPCREGASRYLKQSRARRRDLKAGSDPTNFDPRPKLTHQVHRMSDLTQSSQFQGEIGSKSVEEAPNPRAYSKTPKTKTDNALTQLTQPKGLPRVTKSFVVAFLLSSGY